MISQETVKQVAEQITSIGVDESILASLRSGFTEIHFTWCNDDDIPNNEPVLKQENFNIYLVDGRDHCLCLTSSFENATGIVIAEIYE